jgi:hypothetical protein
MDHLTLNESMSDFIMKDLLYYSHLADRLRSQPSGLKIALISAQPHIKLAYTEKLWAESLSDLETEVCLFYPIKLKANSTYDSYRMRHTHRAHLTSFYNSQGIPSIFLTNTQYLTKNLCSAVLSFQPDILICFNPIKHFCRSIYTNDLLNHVPLMSIFQFNQNNVENVRWWTSNLSWRQRQHGMAFHLLRIPNILQAIRRASLSIANSSKTTDLLRQCMYGEVRGAWARKHIELPLGYCSHTFSFDMVVRKSTRENLSDLKPQDILLLFSSQFQPSEWPTIWKVWQCVEYVMRSNQHKDQSQPKIHMLWIGLNDSQESLQLQTLINHSTYSKQHHQVKQKSQVTEHFQYTISMYYKSADMVLFPEVNDSGQLSVSHQQALGTGAYIYTYKAKNLSSLRSQPKRWIQVHNDHWQTHLATLIHQLDFSHEQQRLDCASEVKQNFSSIEVIKDALKQFALNVSDRSTI